MFSPIIRNEKELRDAKARAAKLAGALSSKRTLEQVVSGLPPEVVSQVTQMMLTEQREIAETIDAYETAKDTGDARKLQARAGGDPGLILIIARIAEGLSQKELAWRLGIKEQQVQRYEAEKYDSISLRNLRRIATLLGVRLEAQVSDMPDFRGLDKVIDNVSRVDIKKILKHGRDNGWFPEETDESELRRQIAENRLQFGSPSLLRTGLNVVDHSEDVLLHAWRARIMQKAREVVPTLSGTFDPLEIDWLPRFVHLSTYEDGPTRALNLLKTKGIILIIEAQIPGLAIDGAAFLEGGVPIIGMTLRKDTLDNFWFTLLHEIGHVILHYRSGLSAGFFDETDTPSKDEQEAEADAFAASLLIPDELWRRSAARISKSPAVVSTFALKNQFHPAIAFGRIRKERKDYSLFSKYIGAGTVRAQLMGRDRKDK